MNTKSGVDGGNTDAKISYLNQEMMVKIFSLILWELFKQRC